MPQTIELSQKFGTAALLIDILSREITKEKPAGDSVITYSENTALRAVIVAIQLAGTTLEDLEKLNDAGIIFIANSENPEHLAKITEISEKGSVIELSRIKRPESTTEEVVILLDSFPKFSITLNGKTPTLNLLEPNHP